MIRADKREPLARFRLPARQRLVRRQLQPDGVRLFYFSALRALMAKAHAMVVAEVLPLVNDLVPDHRDRSDAAQDDRVKAALDAVAKRFARSVTPNALRPLAEKVAAQTSGFQKAQLLGQLRDAIGVEPLIRDAGLSEMADAFTRENIGLIKTVPERYFSSLQQTITEGIASGSRASTIAASMEQRYGVSETNAARIANDQVGKFFADLNDTRQRELGITRAVWATVHDNRVRDSHGQLDGTPYELGVGLVDEDTGETVLPGQAINCRCQGVPDVSGLLGD